MDQPTVIRVVDMLSPQQREAIARSEVVSIRPGILRAALDALPLQGGVIELAPVNFQLEAGQK